MIGQTFTGKSVSNNTEACSSQRNSYIILKLGKIAPDFPACLLKLIYFCTEVWQQMISDFHAGLHNTHKIRKRSLRHLGPKIWDKIDPSLHDSSQVTFKKQYRDVLISAYDDR